MVLKDLLYWFDSVGPFITIQHLGRDRFTTYIGSLISLAVLALTIAGIKDVFYYYLYSVNPDVSTSFSNANEAIQFNKTTMKMYFNLEYVDGSTYRQFDKKLLPMFPLLAKIDYDIAKANYDVELV